MVEAEHDRLTDADARDRWTGNSVAPTRVEGVNVRNVELSSTRALIRAGRGHRHVIGRAVVERRGRLPLRLRRREHAGDDGTRRRRDVHGREATARGDDHDRRVGGDVGRAARRRDAHSGRERALRARARARRSSGPSATVARSARFDRRARGAAHGRGNTEAARDRQDRDQSLRATSGTTCRNLARAARVTRRPPTR